MKEVITMLIEGAALLMMATLLIALITGLTP